MTTHVRHQKGWHQGLFTPANPQKYLGNPNAIRYMSAWEKNMHEFFDRNDNVIQWCSEPFAIPYIKPTDNRVHRYFPDYYVKYKDKYGQIVQEIVEVKPRSQRILREGASRQEVIDYAINQAKWKYAKKWCEERGLKFSVVSERSDTAERRTFGPRKLKKLGKRK